MESYNLGLQTLALPWAVDCPWTQSKPRGTMLYGMLPFALPAHPTLGHRPPAGSGFADPLARLWVAASTLWH